jgi:integrase
MLKQRKSGKPDELIFQKRSGKEGPMAQASNVFNDVVDSLKLNEGITDTKQRITFHTLRHSFATLLYENTHDLYLVQRSLGHATGEMSRRYAKMSENRLREGAEAIEKAWMVDSKDKEEPEAVNSSA